MGAAASTDASTSSAWTKEEEEANKLAVGKVLIYHCPFTNYNKLVCISVVYC